MSTSSCTFNPEWLVNAIRRGFQKYGLVCGNHPWKFVLCSLMTIVVLSVGVIRMSRAYHARDAYTPYGSWSRNEWETYKNFFKYGEPYLFQQVILPNPREASLLESHRMDTIVRLSDYVMESCSVEYEGSNFTFSQLCAPHCRLNEPMRTFNTTLGLEKSRFAKGHAPSRLITLDYPRSNILYRDLFMGRHLFGVTRNLTAYYNKDSVTPIQRVAMVMLHYRADRANETRAAMLRAWEQNVHKCIRTFLRNHSDIEVYYYGDEIITRELLRNGMVGFPYFVVGFTNMLIFVILVVSLGAYWRQEMNVKRIALAIAAVVSPCLAVAAGMGLLFWLGARWSAVLTIVPFLVLAIGVDDAFLMIHSWQRTKLDPASDQHRGDKLAMVLCDVGPSITITSLTNALAFGIGAFTPTPEIRLFCQATALAITADFILQLTMFAPIMVLSSSSRLSDIKTTYQTEPSEPSRGSSPDSDKNLRRDQSPTSSTTDSGSDRDSMATAATGCRSQVPSFQTILWHYCRLLDTIWIKATVALLFIGYLVIAAVGVKNLKSKIGPEKLFLPDSDILKIASLREQYQWADFYQVLVIVNKGFQPDNAVEMAAFHEMLDEFEAHPLSRGKNFTEVWLRDYQTYLDVQETEDFLPFDLIGIGGKRVFDPIQEFFNLAEYAIWKTSVNHHADSRASTEERWCTTIVSRIMGKPANPDLQFLSNGTNWVDSFAFSVVYRNVSNFDNRMNLILTLRKICARYQQRFGVSIFEPDAYLVDQVVGSKNVTIQTVLITLCCMAVVCALFIPNVSSVACASLAITSICLGVHGYLSWWRVDMDPISMATILMAIGFSVDYTAHVSYHYFKTGSDPELQGSSPVNRLFHTLIAVGWPMIQAGLSTVITVTALALVDNYMSQVFVKTVFLVVTLGLLHGILIIPLALISLPDCRRKTSGNSKFETSAVPPQPTNHRLVRVYSLKNVFTTRIKSLDITTPQRIPPTNHQRNDVIAQQNNKNDNFEKFDASLNQQGSIMQSVVMKL